LKKGRRLDLEKKRRKRRRCGGRAWEGRLSDLESKKKERREKLEDDG